MGINGMAWYNFRIGEYEYLPDGPSDYHDYLPQHHSAQALYDLYRDTGLDELDAAIKVFEACVGVMPDAGTT